MAKLDMGSKDAIISELRTLYEEYGVPQLTNIKLDDLRADEIDVVAVGCLVEIPPSGVVLVRREETPDEWLIPGGTVDPGESLRETAVREVREETGFETRITSLLRVGLARNYGPPAFREVNERRFGKPAINLLFANFIAHVISGVPDGTEDPSGNILEVRVFDEVPFESITHVYKVLFVATGHVDKRLSDFPSVEFVPNQ